MALHLLKLAVGIDDIEQLRRVRTVRAAERGGHWVYTRNCPRRAADVLDGGSIYWVIRGHISVRQMVTGFRADRDASGRRYCLIEIDPVLVRPFLAPAAPFRVGGTCHLMTLRPTGRWKARRRRADASGTAGIASALKARDERIVAAGLDKAF